MTDFINRAPDEFAHAKYSAMRERSVGLGVMAGRFTGSLHAHSIWVMKSSVLLGEIEYASLQMDRGAALNCRIKHNWETPPSSVSAARDASPADMMPAELLPQNETDEDRNKP